MARLRWRYDALQGPFIFSSGNDGIPSNATPVAKVLAVGNGASFPVLTTTGQVCDFRARFSGDGDSRVVYNRLYAAGANTGGNSADAFRSMTTVETNLANARGAHISLDFDASSVVLTVMFRVVL